MKGKETLIGAGCGDYDLITLRGKRALERCDTVIYDALIDERLLDNCRVGAEKICVGKRAGRHSSKQEEINELLVRKASEGRNVARLKGGDPFVFGRGGEEILALRAAGIAYSFVPGVTSCVAVPELAGIPVTHRGTARSFHVITGHTANDLLPENFESYAKCGGTLVFLMGLKHLPEIARRLTENGISGKTPAAVISSGATARARVARAMLKDIAAESERLEMKAPAVIVVGETAAFDFSTESAPPLYGKSIAITATPALSTRLIGAFTDLGAYAFRAADFDTRELFGGEIDRAFAELENYSAIALSSPNGADVFIKKLRKKRIDIRRLSGIKLAAIGSGTAKRLAEAGLYADIVPEKFTAAELGKTLAERLTDGEKLLIMRSSDGSPELTAPLIYKGIKFDDVNIYEPIYGGGTAVSADFAVFTSAGGARNFFSGNGTLGGAKAIAIGEVTAAELKRQGVKNIAIPRESTADGIIEKILEEVKCEDSEG